MKLLGIPAADGTVRVHRSGCRDIASDPNAAGRAYDDCFHFEAAAKFTGQDITWVGCTKTLPKEHAMTATATPAAPPDFDDMVAAFAATMMTDDDELMDGWETADLPAPSAYQARANLRAALTAALPAARKGA